MDIRTPLSHPPPWQIFKVTVTAVAAVAVITIATAATVHSPGAAINTI